MSQSNSTPGSITVNSILASAAAFSAAWMVIMATRYYALQATDINGALAVGTDDGSWLATAYAASEPVGVIMGSWLGIVLSLRRMLLIGVTVFLIGSLLPLSAPEYSVLLISRIITGLAGGAIMPQSIIIQLRTWGPTRIPLALALFLSATTAAPQLGGFIGAWGVQHFDWSFVLWAALAPGIVSLAIGYVTLRHEPVQWRALIHADVVGLTSLAASAGTFACALSQGERLRWFQSPLVPVLLVTSAVCLAIFVLRDWSKLRHPMLLAKLYERWNIRLASLGLLSLGLAICLSGVIVPAALAQLQNFRPEQVAPVLWTALWPQALSYAVCVFLLMHRCIEVRVMIIAGLAVVAMGALFDLRITSEWQLRELYMGQLLQGIGLPMLALPLVYMFLGDVRPPNESLPAAGALNLARVLSGTIATAWASTSLRLNSQAKYSEILTNTGFYHAARDTSLATLTARLTQTTTDPTLARARAMRIVAGLARRQAAVLGISDTLATLGCLLFASGLIVVLMAEFGRGRHPARPELPT